MFNLDLIYHQNPSNSCKGFIKIDTWVRGNILYNSWTGFVLNISGGDTRSIIWHQSNMYHHNKVLLDTCSTWIKKLPTYPNPPFWYGNCLMVPQHVIWNPDVYLYHLDDQHYLNRNQNIENRSVFSIICTLISDVSTSGMYKVNMFPIKYDKIPCTGMIIINQVTTDSLGMTVSLTVVVFG